MFIYSFFNLRKITLLLCLGFAVNVSAQSWQSKVTPSVFETLQRQSTADVLIIMNEQGDLSTINSQATKEEKGQKTFEILRGLADRSQADIRPFLTAQNVPFQAFWLVNVLHLTANFELLKALAERSDVAEITNNPTSKLGVLPQDNSNNLPENIIKTWGLQRIGADSGLGTWLSWARRRCRWCGYRLRWMHPALQKKISRLERHNKYCRP